MSDHTNTQLEPCPHFHAWNYDPATVVRGQPVKPLEGGHMKCMDCGEVFAPEQPRAAPQGDAIRELVTTWRARADAMGPEVNRTWDDDGALKIRTIRALADELDAALTAVSPSQKVEEVAAGEQGLTAITATTPIKPLVCIKCGHDEWSMHDGVCACGCVCEFTIAATPIPPPDAVRKAAEEIAANYEVHRDRCQSNERYPSPPCDCGVIDVLAAIISRHLTATVVVDYRKPHTFDPIGEGVDECECGLIRDADLHSADAV